MLNGMTVLGGGRQHGEPNYIEAVFLRRQGAGFDDEGGGRLDVDEHGRDGLNSS